MPRAFTRLAFSTAVKAAQARYGAREHGAKLERAEPSRERLNDELIAYFAQVDSFFIGTANVGNQLGGQFVNRLVFHIVGM